MVNVTPAPLPEARPRAGTVEKKYSKANSSTAAITAIARIIAHRSSPRNVRPV